MRFLKFKLRKNVGIIVNKENDQNDDLTRRINADLREKMQETSKVEDDSDPIEDSEYVAELQKTSRFGWVWIVLIVLAIMSMVFILTF